VSLRGFRAPLQVKPSGHQSVKAIVKLIETLVIHSDYAKQVGSSTQSFRAKSTASRGNSSTVASERLRMWQTVLNKTKILQSMQRYLSNHYTSPSSYFYHFDKEHKSGRILDERLQKL
jgi:hypothetical protein